MPLYNTDPKVTDYIESSEDFAKPILKHVREVLHVNCPDITESIKWGIPHFTYKKDYLCVLAAARKHCSLTFIKSELMSDPRFANDKKVVASRRFLGNIKSLSDLPSDGELAGFIKEVMDLNDRGVKLRRPTKPISSQPLEIPAYFKEALSANPVAKDIFERQSPSYRKNYIIWLESAKTEATRQQRIAESLEWIVEGKGRFWKYEK